MLSEQAESIQLPSGVHLSSENLNLIREGKPELRAEILFLNGMVYIWIGSSSVRLLNNLQMAYPGNVLKRLLQYLLIFILGKRKDSCHLYSNYRRGFPRFIQSNYGEALKYNRHTVK